MSQILEPIQHMLSAAVMRLDDWRRERRIEAISNLYTKLVKKGDLAAAASVFKQLREEINNRSIYEVERQEKRKGLV